MNSSDLFELKRTFQPPPPARIESNARVQKPLKTREEIARESAVEWGESEGWPDSSDIADMQKRFLAAIMKATSYKWE